MCLEQDIPMSMTTQRILMKVPDPIDASSVYEAICESISDLKTWFTWAQSLPNIETCRETAKMAFEAFVSKSDIRYYLFNVDTKAFIGVAGLHRIEWTIPKFEIGFWVRSSYQGQGYAAEAVNALTLLAFNSFRARRVEIRCDEQNVRSRKTAERTGFIFEGVLRHDSLKPDGLVRNTVVYSQIR